MKEVGADEVPWRGGVRHPQRGDQNREGWETAKLGCGSVLSKFASRKHGTGKNHCSFSSLFSRWHHCFFFFCFHKEKISTDMQIPPISFISPFACSFSFFFFCFFFVLSLCFDSVSRKGWSGYVVKYFFFFFFLHSFIIRSRPFLRYLVRYYYYYCCYCYWYYYLLTPWEFFTSALADGLSPKFGWHQVSLSLQDSSQYSGRSQ